MHQKKEHFRYWLKKGEIKLLANGHRMCVNFCNESNNIFKIGKDNNIIELLQNGWILYPKVYFTDNCSEDIWYATYLGILSSGSIAGYIVR